MNRHLHPHQRRQSLYLSPKSSLLRSQSRERSQSCALSRRSGERERGGVLESRTSRCADDTAQQGPVTRDDYDLIRGGENPTCIDRAGSTNPTIRPAVARVTRPIRLTIGIGQ